MKRPPSPGTKRYAAMVKRGCGGRKYETIDGIDYDCDFYDWECDNCPPCVEHQRNKPPEFNDGGVCLMTSNRQP
jgi:hypothetical protein